MKKIIFTTILVSGTLAISEVHNHGGETACKGHEHEHGHAHRHMEHAHCNDGHPHEHDHDANGHETRAGHISVEISEAAARNSGIETVRPRKRAAGSEYVFKGRFELVPEARETVASPVPGKIELKTGSLETVEKGETLFTVTSPAIVARMKEVEILEKRLAVYREIKTPNAELENALAVKKAELDALLMGHTAQNGRIEIKAPKAGLVEEIMQQNGTWLETGSAVLKLTEAGNVRFKGLVPADDANRLRNMMPATVNGSTGSIRIGVGEASGLVPVYVIFAAPPKALPGMRADATVSTGGGSEHETVVPNSAIVEIDLAKYVFIRDSRSKNRFIAVSVSTGEKSGGWTNVAGLPDGDVEIVSKGAYQLKLAASSSSKNTAGHFHADGTFHEGDH